MYLERTVVRLSALLRELREERGISLRQLADNAGVNPSVASRAERGADAKLSTWDRLFEGLGYELIIETTEDSEEAADLLAEEAERREERRREGLCTGKRRFY
jgi:transcriptional regulator with XRE-family HTH domain